MTAARGPVVILGAGINGCALARELALNGLSVTVVDTADVAGGTTAYSSRLIHGGLRYLEYGEFDLVRESLAERGRLLRLAPQFVRPLELFVPIRHRTSGVWQSLRRFMGWEDSSGASHDRGLWLVHLGLWMYDLFARDRSLPKHRIVGVTAGPQVDPQRYRWLAAYYDVQVTFPERLTLALLSDASHAAQVRGSEFEVLTYHEARLAGQTVEIRRRGSDEVVRTLQPAAVVNATGAWVDQTLARLPVAAPRLIGGTKGTHLLTARPDLAAALGPCGIYAEAADGRPFFILPLAGMTLVGTTDEPYEGNPYQAVASPAEIEYLIASLAEVFPQIRLTPGDIAFSYSGVRPLPFVDAATPGAITRRHDIRWHLDAPLPLVSLIGGKLTTCRALAEEAADAVLTKLGAEPTENSRERMIPGGERFPENDEQLAAVQAELAQQSELPLAAISAAWRLHGTRLSEVLAAAEPSDRGRLIAETQLPVACATWAVRHEWAQTLDDLVERRLMLLYKERLARGTLRHLAEVLVAAGRLPASDIAAVVDQTIARLRRHFAKHVEP